MQAPRNLGTSSLQVSPIGLGTWQFSDQVGFAGKFWPKLKDLPFTEIVRASREGGVNWFDTAELYGRGASERAVAGALAALGVDPAEVTLATKWFPLMRGAGSIERTIDARIEALKPYPIGLHQIHAPIALATARAEMSAMGRLLDSGQIQAVGISNYSAAQTRKAQAALRSLGHSVATNQMEYSILNRRIESNGVLDTARELGITIIAYSPLAQGLCTGRFHDQPELLKKRMGWRRLAPPWTASALSRSQPVIDALKRIGARHGATPAQVALNWIVNFHEDAVVAIPGATKLAQAEQNAAALSFVLLPDELAELNDVSLPFKGH